MGNTYESSDTVSCVFEYDIKERTANTGKCFSEIIKMWSRRKKGKKKSKS